MRRGRDEERRPVPLGAGVARTASASPPRGHNQAPAPDEGHAGEVAGAVVRLLPDRARAPVRLPEARGRRRSQGIPPQREVVVAARCRLDRRPPLGTNPLPLLPSAGPTMKNPRGAVPKAVDEYLAGIPGDVRAALERLRKTIKAAAPGAQGGISYGVAVLRVPRAR